MKTYTHTVLLTVGLLTLLFAHAHAQILQISQVVFGMDCAPCAYSLEKRLSHLEGVKKVTISLNTGQAILELSPENKLTIESIRRTVFESGFSPREALVKVQGRLQTQGNQWILITPQGEKFKLITTQPTTQQRLRELATYNQSVVLKGTIPDTGKEIPEQWTLKLDETAKPS